MDISTAGVAFIKNFETLQLKAYKPTLNDVWTIGWGHTSGVYSGMIITDFEAENFLLEDLDPVRWTINNTVFLDLTQPQYDALSSLIFNVGCGAWKSSNARTCLNQKDYAGFADQAFSIQYGWVHQAGKVLGGLVERRALEHDLFFNGVYGVPK